MSIPHLVFSTDDDALKYFFDCHDVSSLDNEDRESAAWEWLDKGSRRGAIKIAADDEMEFWNGVEFESRVSEELNDDEMKFWNGAASDFRNEMFIIMQRKGIDASIAEVKELSQ